MTTTVILYSKQPQTSFISSVLFTDFLHTLRLGKKSYSQIIEAMSSLQGSQWIYAPNQCPGTLKEVLNDCLLHIQKSRYSCMQGDDKVLILNLTYYPLDDEWVDQLFAKTLQTDVPLLVQKKSENHTEFVAAGMTYTQLNENNLMSLEPAVINIDQQHFADLTDTETALRLFSSGFSLRYFNSLKLSRKIYFLKSSADEKKMRAEYSFFRNLPASVRPYFPHVGDLVTQEKKAGYEIEVIPCLDVAKSLFNGVFSNETRCRTLVNALGAYLDACPRKTVSTQEYIQKTRAFFVDKTQVRVQKTLELEVSSQMNRVCQLNGFESFEQFAQSYIQALETDIAANPQTELNFSHGDLFFSNILFDPTKQYIKIIDPKGITDDNPETTYMPAWYDLAKLSHSFLGHYDLMVYDMMDIVMLPDMSLGLKSNHIAGLESLKAHFLKLLETRRIPLKRVRLYEGSLFLSMLPLHADDPLRMQRQLIRAMELYRFATHS